MYVATEYVLEFHRAFQRLIGDPRRPSLDPDFELRLRFLNEEFTELTEALLRVGPEHEAVEYDSPEHRARVAKEACDLIYVVVGSMIAWGIDLAPVFEAVHRSNMSKQGADATGKVIKGPGYEPPDVIAAMQESADFFASNPEAGWSDPDAG